MYISLYLVCLFYHDLQVAMLILIINQSELFFWNVEPVNIRFVHLKKFFGGTTYVHLTIFTPFAPNTETARNYKQVLVKNEKKFYSLRKWSLWFVICHKSLLRLQLIYTDECILFYVKEIMIFLVFISYIVIKYWFIIHCIIH